MFKGTNWDPPDMTQVESSVNNIWLSNVAYLILYKDVWITVGGIVVFFYIYDLKCVCSKLRKEVWFVCKNGR